jgi:hypothetical protein
MLLSTMHIPLWRACEREKKDRKLKTYCPTKKTRKRGPGQRRLVSSSG